MYNPVYFSQADSRWANYPYPSSLFPNANMKSSGCGVTCGAMIVSSFKNIVYPNEMADIFRNNGFRASTGTSSDAFPWIGENYDIRCELKWKLDEAMDCLRKGGMVVALCHSGLFTTDGHYIVLAGLKDENTILVYDPYLYTNKFNLYGRNGKATVEGNNVYVSYSNFKEYAGYSSLYCYYPEEQNIIITVKQMYVNTQSANLNVRDSIGGTIIDKLSKGALVTVFEERDGWARIGDNRWVNSLYLKTSIVEKMDGYSLGKYVVATASGLNVRKSPRDGQVVKVYKNGTRFDTYEITDNWARTPSGWVCLDYCKLLYSY